MPRIDRFLEYRTWGDLHKVTQEYVKNNLIDVVKTYEFNQDNDYIEENDGCVLPLVFLKNGLVIWVERADVWHCNVGAGVDIEFDADQYFERV